MTLLQLSPVLRLSAAWKALQTDSCQAFSLRRPRPRPFTGLEKLVIDRENFVTLDRRKWTG